MEKARKILYYGSLAIIVVTVCFLLYYYYRQAHENDVYEELRTQVSVTPAPPPQTAVPQPTPEPHLCPIDFTALAQTSENIYAWLNIPALDIAYPVVQHPTDDTYYLRRDVQGQYNDHGSIYSEASVNTTDFAECHTILYGHNFVDGTMLSNLTQYRDKTVLENSGDIYIYTPDRELRYKAFAAVTYSNGYLPYYFDDEISADRQAFLDGLPDVVRDLNNNILEDVPVTEDRRLLILSTCTGGTDHIIHRYLVVAVLEEERPWDDPVTAP